MSTPRRKALRVREVRPQDYRIAAELVREYRETGNGSNRTNWERVAFLVAACLTVVATGESVMVPANRIPDGDSPVYNRIHRMLSAGIVRPYWSGVRIDVLKNVTVLKTLAGGRVHVEGEPTSTGKNADTLQSYISPVG